MNIKKMSMGEYLIFIYFIMLSIYRGIGTYGVIQMAGIDSYLSIIIAFFLGLFLIFLFYYIFSYRVDLNILEKNKVLFGSVGGNIINYLIHILYFIIGMILLYNISNFVISQFLDRTPILMFMIMMGLVIFYNVSCGINNMARVSIIFLFFIILLSVISIIGIYPHFDLSNLKPILDNNIGHTIKAGVYLAFSLVMPLFLLLVVSGKNISYHRHFLSRFVLVYFLSFLLIFINNVFTIGSLGIRISKLYQYPEYMVLQKITFFNFIDRIENIIYIQWIFTSMISLSCIVYYISKYYQNIITHYSSLFVSLFIVLATYLFFSSNTFYYEFSYAIFPFLGMTLFFLFLLVGIRIYFKKKL